MNLKGKKSLASLMKTRVNKNAGVKARNQFSDDYALLLEPIDQTKTRPSRTIVLSEKIIEDLKDHKGDFYFFQGFNGEIKNNKPYKGVCNCYFVGKDAYVESTTGDDALPKKDFKKLAGNWTFASTKFYEQFEELGYNEGDTVTLSKGTDEDGIECYQFNVDKTPADQASNDPNEAAYEPHLDNSTNVDNTPDPFPAEVREDFSN